MDVYVGRQPIFDRSGNIYGYELLYRNSETNSFPDVDPEQATKSLLINTFITIGFEKVSGGRRAFVNFTEELLLERSLNIHPDQVVIEVLEGVRMTPKVIHSLREYKKAGFKIALDDFVLSSEHMQYPELFTCINFIKVDFLNTSEQERKAIEDLAKDYPNITLLAEKIETEAEYMQAKEVGYNLFQGYFFERPEIIKAKDIPANYVMHLHVINMLRKNNPNITEIAGMIGRDVSLSFKMLRYINSLAFGIPNKISSIKQALVLMGLEEGTKWMQILLVHDMGKGSGNGRTQALVEKSLTRAKLCELIAEHKNKPHADMFFLMALFSMINLIMRRKMEDILPLLSLSSEIQETISGHNTAMTPYLELVIAVEDLDMPRIDIYSQVIGIEKEYLAKYTHEAYSWVNKFND